MSCERLALLGLMVLSLGRPAEAAPAEADAKAAAARDLAAGNDLFEHHQYEEALARFRDAYARYPRPILQFNIGRACEELGRDGEARAAFATYIAGAPEDDVRRLEAQRRLDAANARLAVAPPAPLPTGGPPAATPPAAAPLSLVASPPPADAVRRPLYERWWFWSAVGVAAIATTAILVAANRGGGTPGTALGTQTATFGQ
jgi:tetratricopeptide (TPR) repeat protein